MTGKVINGPWAGSAANEARYAERRALREAKAARIQAALSNKPRLDPADREVLARNLGKMATDNNPGKPTTACAEFIHQWKKNPQLEASALKKRQRWFWLDNDRAINPEDLAARGSDYVGLAKAIAEICKNDEADVILRLAEGTSFDDSAIRRARLESGALSELMRRLDAMTDRIRKKTSIDAYFEFLHRNNLEADDDTEAELGALRFGGGDGPASSATFRHLDEERFECGGSYWNYSMALPSIPLGALLIREPRCFLVVRDFGPVATDGSAERIEQLETALEKSGVIDALRSRESVDSGYPPKRAYPNRNEHLENPGQLYWAYFYNRVDVELTMTPAPGSSSSRACFGLKLDLSGWGYDHCLSRLAHVATLSGGEAVARYEGTNILVIAPPGAGSTPFEQLRLWDDTEVHRLSGSCAERVLLQDASLLSFDIEYDLVTGLAAPDWIWRLQFDDPGGLTPPVPASTLGGAILRNLAFAPDEKRLDTLLIAAVRKQTDRLERLKEAEAERYNLAIQARFPADASAERGETS
jgi:hypothetical protein